MIPNNKPQYEPPQVRDLSGLSASGVELLATCSAGHSVSIGSCLGGGKAASKCSPTGVAPDYGHCVTGTNGTASQCASGTVGY